MVECKDMTKTALYKMCKDMRVKGRSNLSKEEMEVQCCEQWRLDKNRMNMYHACSDNRGEWGSRDCGIPARSSTGFRGSDVPYDRIVTKVDLKTPRKPGENNTIEVSFIRISEKLDPLVFDPNGDFKKEFFDNYDEITGELTSRAPAVNPEEISNAIGIDGFERDFSSFIGPVGGDKSYYAVRNVYKAEFPIIDSDELMEKWGGKLDHVLDKLEIVDFG